MSQGDSDAMAHPVPAADDAADAAGAGGAGAAGPGADGAAAGTSAASAGNTGVGDAGDASAGAQTSASSAGAEPAGAGATAPEITEVIEEITVIEASADPVPGTPENEWSPETRAQLFNIAAELRAHADADRIVAAAQDGEAASLAEAARMIKEELAAQEDWPMLGAAKQHPKRRRSLTPAAKPAPPIDGPCASDEPRYPNYDLEGLEIPAAQPAMGQGIPGGDQETPSPDAAPEEPAQRSVRFEGPPPPKDAPMGQAPELPAAEEVEAVPSKPMPKPPPATMARPNPYRDIRLLPPVTGPSPELIASIDRQMAAEREARIAAAWKEQMAPPKASSTGMPAGPKRTRTARARASRWLPLLPSLRRGG